MKLKSALWLGLVSCTMVSMSANASIEVKAKRMLTENTMTENVTKVQ
ncbi:hypothetical protein HKB31_01455, partial [Vibrio alginolyticus]|nr:hypothetical protein [Vibrio alginolyticus]